MGKPKEWPRTVTVGHASVKVYRIAHHSSSGWIYVLAWQSPQGRRREKFADPAAAINEARTKAGQLNNGRIEGASMTTGDRDELSAARVLAADMPVLAALKEWGRIRELTQGHGIAAAELWAQRNRRAFKRIKVSDAVDTFILQKNKAGKEGERTYRAKLKPLAELFGERFIDSLTAHELSAYLENYADGVTRNDLRKRAIALWRWSQKSGYIPHGMQLEIEHTERAAEKATEIGTLTPSTYARLLEFFRATHPEHLAALVVAGFCAVRSDEIQGKQADRSKRQTWEDIDLKRQHLNVTVAKKNTPSWRLVEICDAAVEWLLLCPNRTGAICEDRAMEKIRILAKGAGFDLPENCFRHSAISYRIAVTGNKAETATWAGNSVAEIDRRYRRPMTKEAGLQWFGLLPSAIAEVIKLEA